MKEIDTLKSLKKFTQENPNLETIYISQKLSNYITLLQAEYTDELVRGIPMKSNHKRDYWLFNDCIVCNGVSFLIKEEILK